MTERAPLAKPSSLHPRRPCCCCCRCCFCCCSSLLSLRLLLLILPSRKITNVISLEYQHCASFGTSDTFTHSIKSSLWLLGLVTVDRVSTELRLSDLPNCSPAAAPTPPLIHPACPSYCRKDIQSTLTSPVEPRGYNLFFPPALHPRKLWDPPLTTTTFSHTPQPKSTVLSKRKDIS